MSPRSRLAALSALLSSLAPVACSAPARPAAAAPSAAQDPAPAPSQLPVPPAPAAPAPGPAPPPPIDLALAARYFAEADQTCRAEAGQLWGESLCGAMLLVDPATRFAVANQPDAEAALTPRDQVHVGTLPAGAAMANTAFEWSGVRWAEIVRAPSDPTGRPLRGEGWELQLAPGWSIDRGPRTGDWVLRGPP